MEAYTIFAEVYDLFMDNIDYSGWADYIRKLLREHGIEETGWCWIWDAEPEP